ncbi:MAG: large cysteine-rich periplasmic protein OmcB [Planctomycetota bacterium]
MTNRRFTSAAVLALLALAAGAPLAWGQERVRTPEPQAPRGPELVRTENYYPSGTRATSAILVERFTPSEVRINTDFEYQIKVTNLTQRELRDVVLVEQFPATLKVKATGPATRINTDDRTGSWTWAKIAPGATETIRVQATTDAADPLSMCATVTFEEVFCATTKVVEPKLALQKFAPAEVILCDPIPLRFVVTNPGTGVVNNVKITDALPAGLATADGKTSLTFDAGDLAAGQSREFTATVQAAKTGDYKNTAKAQDASGLTAEASAATIVRQPVLAIRKTGPDLRYVGRTAKFEITVENTGDAPARDAVLTDMIPAGTEVVEADGGQTSAGKVAWNLGTLAPKASRKVSLTLKCNDIGKKVNNATVEAYCAKAAASLPFEVRGIPAVLLEVVDEPDPIEIAGIVTYTIEVTNQGSAVGTNIVIDCMLPPELQYQSATGPTQAKVSGQNVKFEPLPSLAPKAKVTFKVVAKGVKEGDVRFKVSMTTDQTTSPVEETESTHVY